MSVCALVCRSIKDCSFHYILTSMPLTTLTTDLFKITGWAQFPKILFGHVILRNLIMVLDGLFLDTLLSMMDSPWLSFSRLLILCEKLMSVIISIRCFYFRATLRKRINKLFFSTNLTGSFQVFAMPRYLLI